MPGQPDWYTSKLTALYVQNTFAAAVTWHALAAAAGVTYLLLGAQMPANLNAGSTQRFQIKDTAGNMILDYTEAISQPGGLVDLHAVPIATGVGVDVIDASPGGTWGTFGHAVTLFYESL